MNSLYLFCFMFFILLVRFPINKFWNKRIKAPLLFLAFSCFAFSSFAGFKALDKTTDLGVIGTIVCDSGVTCTKTGIAKLNIDVGQVNQVVATATTITESQCGSTFINAGAVQMELPEASTVLGCRLTFITGNASNFDVNPDDADQILVETNAAGDAIRNGTLGNSITLQAISASQWTLVAVSGTYSDID